MNHKRDKYACAAGGMKHHLQWILQHAVHNGEHGYVISEWIIEHAREYMDEIFENGLLKEVDNSEAIENEQ